MIEDIGEFKGNKYRFVNFVASTPDGSGAKMFFV